MIRRITPKSSLDNLKREAKRWLHALRSGDARARARFERALPNAPVEPTLRHVQHALAREHGFGRVSRDIWELVYAGNIVRFRELLRGEPDLAKVAGPGTHAAHVAAAG